ncbi:MAG: caspase family protein [Xenococcus sp. (in: cyanobacteria)]
MTEFNRSLAVVIGINDYHNGIDSLQTAVPDAFAIATLLQKSYEYQLVHPDSDRGAIVNQQATKSKLETLLKDILPNQIKPTKRDRLLFYFAGHGIARNRDEGPEGYLVPQDGNRKNTNSLIRMRNLHDWLSQLECRHLLVILDCCFAGTFRWASTRKLIPIAEEITEAHYNRFVKFDAWQVLTSASYNQEALDFLNNRDIKPDRQHSPFAEGLIKALKEGEGDLNQDGVIIATELYLYLRDYVELNSQEKQTPLLFSLKKHDRGEYIFKLPNTPLKLKKTPTLNKENNPYRGLEPFEEKHSRFFFGREELVQKLAPRLSHPEHRLTIVLGASGSGKSSLVKAGLISHLRKTQEKQWHILKTMRPGENTFASLAQVIEEIAPNCRDTLQQDPNVLVDIITSWSKQHPQTKLLLVIDQFEELITLTCQTDATDQPENSPSWQAFLKLLATTLETCPQFHLIVTLRSDFETRFFDSSLSPYWAKARFPLRPMRSDELREAIERPASEMALTFEPPNLVDRLIDEVGQMPGALPLLSFTLSELYIKLHKAWQEEDKEDRSLTIDAEFDRQGGVVGSLTSRANQEYNNLGDEKVQTTMRRVILRMLTVEGWEVARRQVPDSELLYPDEAENQRVKKVIERLVAARLVVKGQGTEEAYVEPAHDYLVRGWNRLQDWIKEDREDLTLQQRLTPDANYWVRNGRPKDNYLLPDDDRLHQLEKIFYRKNNWFNQNEAEFIQVSIEYRDFKNRLSDSRKLAEKSNSIREDQQANKLQLSVLLAVEAIKRFHTLEADRALRKGLALLLPVHTCLTHAKAVKAIALSPDGQILACAGGTRNVPNQFSEKLSPCKVELWSISDYQNIENIDHLLHDSSIKKIIFSRDSKYLATLSGWLMPEMLPNTVQVWDLETRTLVNTIEIPNGVKAVTLSPDSKSQSLIIGCKKYIPSPFIEFLPQEQQNKLEKQKENNYTLVAWNFANNEIIKYVDEYTVSAVIFSPDGKYLATASEDKIARIWDIKSYQCRRELPHQGEIKDLNFSPDGKYLVTISKNLAQTWEVETGETLSPPLEHDGSIEAMAFSPTNSSQLATVSSDRTAKVWDIITGNLIARFEHDATIDTVIFSPDGQTLSTATVDCTMHLWLISEKREIGRVIHQNQINGVLFSQEGDYILTASDDRTVRFWKTNNDLEVKIFPHTSDVKSISFSVDGNYLATAEDNHTVQLWNWHTCQKMSEFSNETYINAMTLSADGRYLAVADQLSRQGGYKVSIWDVFKKQKIKEDLWHKDIVNALAFSPNGSYLATASGSIWANKGFEEKDNAVRLWDVVSGRPPISIPHQSEVHSITFSLDGTYWASGCADGTVHLFTINSSQPIFSKAHLSNAPIKTITSIAFSPDGQLLATGSQDATVRFWEIATGAEIGNKCIHCQNPVNSVAFSPDGNYLLTAISMLWKSENAMAQIWKIDSQPKQEIAHISHHEKPISRAMFSPDGRYVVTIGGDHQARFWYWQPDDLISQASQRLTRGLTQTELERYL